MRPSEAFGRLITRLRRASRARRALYAAIALALLSALILALGLGARRERADPIWERIQHSGVIRVGMEASFPPFEVVDGEGHFYGYDVDLARELAQRLGIPQVAFVNIHFDGLYDALQDGKIDVIISALPFERERTRDVRYSVPYFHAGQVLTAPANADGIQGLADLAGKRVAVEMGSQAHYTLRQIVARQGLDVEVLTTYTAQEALDWVLEGRAEAALADAVTVYAYPHQDLMPVGPQLTDEPYVIAVPLEGRILVDKINRALADMAEDGFQDALHAEWF